MTPDPILILAATTILLSLAGLCLFARLRAAERKIDRLHQDLETVTDVVNGSLNVLSRVSAESHNNARTLIRIIGKRWAWWQVVEQAKAIDGIIARLKAVEANKTTPT
jgi:Flp pilus assembly protein TadB